VPAGVVSAEVLAVMVLVDPPTGFASAVPDSFSGDGGWLVISAAEKGSLAPGDITEGCNVLLFAALSLSSFGGPGHPLEPWPPLATILIFLIAPTSPRPFPTSRAVIAGIPSHGHDRREIQPDDPHIQSFPPPTACNVIVAIPPL
jgi:hypothetical protein